MHLKLQARSSAVSVRSGCKSYGKEVVLDGLDMTVPTGCIYALLGSSGCGKTTLLSSIVGVKQLSSGSIQLFGRDVAQIEKNLLGYMPQETGLHAELRISEELHFFGRLYGLSWTLVEERMDALLKLLQLPGKHALIQNLSGGETRRVSLAVALLHKPRLIILDEATVGIDPLLRQNIWEHLHKLVREDGVTIILSTHYTEEARKADVVSVMRNGRLLVEENPQTLMDRYDSSLLETVVVNLCKSQEMGQKRRESNTRKNVYIENETKYNNDNNNDMMDDEDCGGIMGKSFKRRQSVESGDLNYFVIMEPPPFYEVEGLDSRKIDGNYFYRNWQIIYAMLTLNFITFTRFPIILFFFLILPAFQCFVCWGVYRPEPHPNIGFVNHEQPECFKLEPEEYKLGCELITFMIHDGKLGLEQFYSEQSAQEAIHLGRNYGYFVIPHNFSANSAKRIAFGRFVDGETLHGSFIPVYLDLSNYVRNLFLLNGLSTGYKGFAEKKFKDAMKSSNNITDDSGFGPPPFLEPFKINTRLAKLLPVETTWYDKGAMLTVTTFMMVMPAVIGITLVWDIKRGVFQRTMMGGGNFWHLLISAIIAYGLLYLGQLSCCIFIIKALGTPFLGSVLDVFTLNYGQHLVGLMLGILLGFLLNQEVEVIFFILGFFFLAGFSGAGAGGSPESLDFWTRTYVVSMPTKLASVAMENILFRGWSLALSGMWSCFVVQVVWISSILFLNIIAYYNLQF